ncbi:MAG: 3-isopropylmalate dehydratase large subunit [Thermoprotei archaeon]|nr:MAG: 3-isopropylmalate dehydratase large subunit [Thermoprotei archaeon]RLF13459.1 MAG: 3-isopropylmalate dehydratase large subunit [Thermoprotei archaeon]
MGMTITEKILARASGKKEVSAGELVVAKVDVAMIHDFTGPMTVKALKAMGAPGVWDPSRVVVIFDHQVPASSLNAAEFHKMLRAFVKEHGITNFYDVGRGGICHQIMPEEGFVVPGSVIVGADSHTTTYGALGAFATGLGSTDMAAAIATGELWFRVPETLKVQVDGKVRPPVSAKDLTLAIIGIVKADGATYKAVEYSGEGVKDLSIEGRLTMCNMAVEMGAKNGIVEPDAKTEAFLKGRARFPYQPVKSDPDANYEKEVRLEADKLEPVVACPHSVDNVKVVVEVEGIEVDQAFIGSCTNGRLEDLEVAAKILKGRKVHPRTRLVVIPASQRIYHEATKRGLIEIFVEAGAMVCNPTCGPCLGSHLGILGDGETCISAANRNFIGRMGSPKSKVYLASPATVAASAIEGKITDPRKYWS